MLASLLLHPPQVCPCKWLQNTLIIGPSLLFTPSAIVWASPALTSLPEKFLFGVA